MVIEIKSPAALNEAERKAWAAIRTASPGLRSPYFGLGFIEEAAAVRPRARVAVMRCEAGEIVGFLPYQADPLGFARPVAGPMSDANGFLVAPETDVDVHAVMRAARLGVFAFTFAPGGQRALGRFARQRFGGHVVDLSQGAEDYFAKRRAKHGNMFKNLPRKRRKLEREWGELVFRVDDRRPEAFKTLLAWKSAQYAASGHFDVFSVTWTRALLQRLWARSPAAPPYGIFSTLEAGGRLVAAHFGMIEGAVWHYWFPAYDVEAQTFSPGQILLSSMIEAAEALGVSEVHLGAGDNRYKREFSSYEAALMSGVAHAPSPAAFGWRAASLAARSWRGAPVGRVAELPGRALRRLDRIVGFRVG